MDRILGSLVEDFLKELEIESLDDDKNFENFSVYSVVSSNYNRDFDLDLINTGGGDDAGIDGLAIIVNGKLVENTSDIDFLLENNYNINATYVFVQATTQGFESGKLRDFAAGVEDFFMQEHVLRRNDEIKRLSEISDYLFSKSHRFNQNPICKIYYVSAKSWRDDQNHSAIMTSSKTRLTDTNNFSSVVFLPLGSAEIQEVYRKTKSKTSATFTFEKKITLPELPGITEAYYGILPMSEFQKILIDENDNLRNVFYDNVRDFYGLDNPVNNKIAETLSGAKPELFTVLNNGITVVAADLNDTGEKFTISDYSIVNGCQTSNVLYSFLNNKNIQDLKIPVKLIVTKNDDIKNNITIATNSQTAVKREQLQAMTDFQKMLEKYYSTFSGDGKLFYERRPKQFQTDLSVPKSRVISIPAQIKAFGAMFLNKPDRVTSYFGSVVKEDVEGENKKKKQYIFHPEHQPIVYYTSALAYYRLESFIKTKKIDKKYKKYRYFILALVGMLKSVKSLSTEKMKAERHANKLCLPIIDLLNDEQKALELFQNALKVIDKSGIVLEDKDNLKNINTKNTFDKYFERLYGTKIIQR